MAAPAGKIKQNRGPVYHFIKAELPKVRYKKNVWDAFLNCSGLDKKDADFFVTSGIFPEVHPTKRNVNGKKVNGYFSRSEPLRIYIHNRVLNAYVKKAKGSDLLLESTIMHELVHLGLFLSGYHAGEIISDGKSVEAGKEFERDAYGRDVNLKNMKKLVGGCGSCGT